MKRQVTLKQIAKELGVSIPTVSKALRDSKEISEETKQKVKAFAKLFNYRPNNIALSLKNRRTKTIGLIIPEIVHYFFSKVIRGVEIVANIKGYNVVVGLSSESFDKEVINMEMLANGSIDGFILSLSKETMLNQDYHHFIEAINQGMPVVMFDRVVNDIECDKVVIDDLEGSKRAVQKLIKNGAKKIVAITTKDYVSVGRLRTQGYIEAMEEHNMPLESNLILKLDDTIDYDGHLDLLEKEIGQLYKSNKGIDGVFAVNELYAVTAMNVARKMGKSIPEDIQIIGFTDGVLSRHASPSLTTINQKAEEMGKTAARLLIERLENETDEEAYKTVVLQTQIIERDSTIN